MKLMSSPQEMKSTPRPIHSRMNCLSPGPMETPQGKVEINVAIRERA